MTDKEIISRQAEKIIILEDKLAESKETSDFWYKECQKRMPIKKLSFDETVSALAHAEVPNEFH